MSLIAVTFNDNVSSSNTVNPFIIGDLLISSSTEKRNIPLPTFPEGAEIHLSDGAKLFPIGLQQKIYVIRDDVAVGLTGNVGQMVVALTEIKKFCAENPLDPDENKQQLLDISKLDNRIASLNLNDCHFYLLNCKGDGKAQFYRHGNWMDKRTFQFGFTEACGSGARDFLDYVDTMHQNSFQASGNPIWNIIKRHLTFFGQLLGFEIDGAETIMNYWGINFELIFRAEKRFRKLDPISYLVYRIRYNIDEETQLVAPLYYFESNYREDILLIYSFEFKTRMWHIYPVYPIDKNPKNINTSLISMKEEFNTQDLCIIALYEFSNGKHYHVQLNTHSSSIGLENPVSEFRYSDKTKQLDVYLSDDIQEAILDVALKGVGLR